MSCLHSFDEREGVRRPPSAFLQTGVLAASASGALIVASITAGAVADRAEAVAVADGVVGTKITS